MKETLIEVLIHIFNQILEDEDLTPNNSNKLIEKLEQAGAEIQYSSHPDLSHAQIELIRDFYETFAHSRSQRHLSSEELNKIGLSGWEYLIALEKAGITPAWIRELILYEVSSIEKDEISISELKTMVLQIMQKIIQKEEDIVWLEHYLFATNEATNLH